MFWSKDLDLSKVKDYYKSNTRVLIHTWSVDQVRMSGPSGVRSDLFVSPYRFLDSTLSEDGNVEPCTGSTKETRQSCMLCVVE